MTKKEYILDFLKEINYAYNHPAMYDDLKRLLDEMEEEILESANCINREEALSECVSRDKAIVQLNHLQSDWDDDWNVAIRKCIETIKKLPAVTQQPCDDVVSRQAVLDTIGNVPDHDDGMVWEALSHAQRDVALLPSVSPTPKIGHWIKCIDDNGSSYYLCSACRCGEDFKFDWCPNCGTKMSEIPTGAESEG